MARSRAKDEGATPPGEDIAELTFEQALERLEAINDRIESGEIGLEASLTEYELGMRLIAHCQSILARADQRVAELTPESDDAGSDDR